MVHRRRFTVIFLAGVLSLSACIPFFGSRPEPEENLLSTLAMQTVSAQQTQSAFSTLTALLSQTPTERPPETGAVTDTAQAPTATLQSPTATLPPATETPTPTTAVPTVGVTPVPFTPTATPVPCNRAQFVEDVQVRDGAEFYPGESFTKIWRLRNTGTCTWSKDYAVVFVDGNQMSGPVSQPLGVTVAPGQTVDVAVPMTAPSQRGTFTGYWQLRSSGGVLFGIGDSAQSSFWVRISVLSPRPTEVGLKYSLADAYCSAEWRSNHGLVSCPTSASDADRGLVARSFEPVLEGGYQEDQAAIILQPGSGRDGFITGTFPAFRVSNYDDFRAVIGCMDRSPKCDVTFQLSYTADGGPVQSLGTWTQKSDGEFETIVLDLNHLAGKQVRFILTVYNNGDSTDDRVFWLLPSVR